MIQTNSTENAKKVRYLGNSTVGTYRCIIVNFDKVKIVKFMLILLSWIRIQPTKINADPEHC